MVVWLIVKLPYRGIAGISVVLRDKTQARQVQGR